LVFNTIQYYSYAFIYVLIIIQQFHNPKQIIDIVHFYEVRCQYENEFYFNTEEWKS